MKHNIIINIENIPLYEDSIGPFGSTTSDTIRTSVTKDTKKILLFVVCFGKDNIEENKQMAIDLYTNYCHARNITFVDVKKDLPSIELTDFHSLIKFPSISYCNIGIVFIFESLSLCILSFSVSISFS